MRWFERRVECECGESLKQTATRLPLDWIGKALAEDQKKDFQRRHKCYLNLKYTKWIRK